MKNDNITPLVLTKDDKEIYIQYRASLVEYCEKVDYVLFFSYSRFSKYCIVESDFRFTTAKSYNAYIIFKENLWLRMMITYLKMEK